MHKWKIRVLETNLNIFLIVCVLVVVTFSLSLPKGLNSLHVKQKVTESHCEQFFFLSTFDIWNECKEFVFAIVT